MPKRTLPGLGLEAYFDLGENGWNDEFDENFRKLSFLVDGRVKSRTTNLPGTGADGDVFIVPVGQTNQNQVAIWDGPTGSKAWVYYPASKGWAFYVLDENKNYQFNGTAWVEFAAAGNGGGGAVTFLDLTDTPADYIGQAGKAVLVNPSGTGLVFGDISTAGGSGSSENWAVPWRGATVTMAAQTLNLNSTVTLSWDTLVADTDNFWNSAAPTVFTIPAGVTKVRCFMTLFLGTGAISSSTAYAAFAKNGIVRFAGNGIMAVDPGYNNWIQSLVSGVIDVVEGDTISVVSQFSDTTIPVLDETFFQIEVVEATDRSALSKLHPFFIPGLPAAGATVYQTVFTERTILKTTTPTRLYAEVAATSLSVFTLTRNGIAVGTITVPASGQTGTVSVSTDVIFNAGDRLSVVAPSTQDATLANVAITLALQLTS